MKKLDIFYHEIFFSRIKEKVEDHRNIIISSPFRSHENINLDDGIPKLTIFANHDEWYVEDID